MGWLVNNGGHLLYTTLHKRTGEGGGGGGGLAALSTPLFEVVARVEVDFLKRKCYRA